MRADLQLTPEQAKTIARLASRHPDAHNIRVYPPIMGAVGVEFDGVDVVYNVNRDGSEAPA